MRIPAALILLVLIVLAVATDRLWLALDHAIPSWDDAYHLNIALAYRDTLQGGVQLFSGAWWAEMLQHANKKPPLGNLLAGVAMLIGGASADVAMWSFAVPMALLVIAVHALAARLWGRACGLWAAAFVVVLPGLMPLRHLFLADLHITALVAAAFACLTFWHFARSRAEGWLAALGFGLAFGLGLLSKPTIVLFLLVPAVMLLVRAVLARRWVVPGQFLVASLVALPIALPWYMANAIFLVGGWHTSLVVAARAEGDPMPWTLAAWQVYPGLLPGQLGWPLLVMGVAGIIGALGARGRLAPVSRPGGQRGAVVWMVAFVLGAYVLLTLVPNKDSRFIAPWLPLLVVLVVGLSHGFSARIGAALRSLALVLTAVAAMHNAFALPVLSSPPLAGVTGALAPHAPGRPTREDHWPGHAVLARIADAAPHQMSTLGLVTGAADSNEHTFGFFGRLQTPRVYAREIGARDGEREYESAAYDWFLVNTADPRLQRGPMQAMLERIGTDPALIEVGRWPGVQEGAFILYRRSPERLRLELRTSDGQSGARLEEMSFPSIAAAGSEIEVRYRVSGPAQALRDAVLLVTWLPEAQAAGPDAAAAQRQPERQAAVGWLHDHPLTAGMLASGEGASEGDNLLVDQRLIMLGDAPAGQYRARVDLLDPHDGHVTRLDGGEHVITLVADGTAPVPVTQSRADPNTRLRHWAEMLRQGPPRFDALFADVGRTNMATPRQAYIGAAEAAARHRLRQTPGDTSLHYQRAMACVLQRDADCASDALRGVLAQAPGDGIAHAYLAFVEIIRLDGAAAREALNEAERLIPELAELRFLRIGVDVVQGRLIAALRGVRAL